MPHKPTITLQPNVHRNEPIALLQFAYNRNLIDAVKLFYQKQYNHHLKIEEIELPIKAYKTRYNITQIPSDFGNNFKALHTMIHQVKSWLRTTYSWVVEKNIDRYFSEFCYRINRSQNKDTIFNNLLERMVSTKISHMLKLYAVK